MAEVQAAKKQNRHVVVALNHMTKRRDALMAQVKKLQDEVDGLDTAIKALAEE